MSDEIRPYLDRSIGIADWSCLDGFSDEVEKVVSTFGGWGTTSLGKSSLAVFRLQAPLLWQESLQVSRMARVTAEDVLAANAYYDVAALSMGCTAFAVDSESGPIHGHCLDWDEGAEVARESGSLVRFVIEGGTDAILSLGWPGFLGVLTGMAPGKFAVTLNAVWSEDERLPAAPVALVLRRVLSTAQSFDDAVALLASVRLACDCILLVTGTKPGELVVVERTPSRNALRRTQNGVLLATNHYLALAAGSNRQGYVATGHEPFGLNSHMRYCDAMSILAVNKPESPAGCLAMLSSPPFRHGLTIRQMVMRAATSDFFFDDDSVNACDGGHKGALGYGA